MTPLRRKPKDRDFVRTREGMFFCVTGYLHPPDRYTAYLKYSPDPAGTWQGAETTYRREMPYYHVREVAQNIDYLKTHYPHYVHYCPVRDIQFSMTPHVYVERYYTPEKRLQEILSGPRDPLEQEVCTLLAHLEEESGIPTAAFGVTGSTLTAFHNLVWSDIDLMVYGQENAFQLRRLLKTEGTQVRRPSAEWVDRWCARIGKRFHLSPKEVTYLGQRRWNYGFFDGRYLSIHTARADDEITERYGDRIYRDQGMAQIRAVLTDASESLFLPAVYEVGQVQVMEGNPAAEHVKEIISYEGLFCDVAEVGQEVIARGKLETVNGEPIRLVIGTTQLAGAGYIMPSGVAGK